METRRHVWHDGSFFSVDFICSGAGRRAANNISRGNTYWLLVWRYIAHNWNPETKTTQKRAKPERRTRWRNGRELHSKGVTAQRILCDSLVWMSTLHLSDRGAIFRVLSSLRRQNCFTLTTRFTTHKSGTSGAKPLYVVIPKNTLLIQIYCIVIQPPIMSQRVPARTSTVQTRTLLFFRLQTPSQPVGFGKFERIRGIQFQSVLILCCSCHASPTEVDWSAAANCVLVSALYFDENNVMDYKYHDWIPISVACILQRKIKTSIFVCPAVPSLNLKMQMLTRGSSLTEIFLGGVAQIYSNIYKCTVSV